MPNNSYETKRHGGVSDVLPVLLGPHSTRASITNGWTPPRVPSTCKKAECSWPSPADCILSISRLEGSFFVLHERPAGATRWQEPCIKTIFNRHDVDVVVGHQCQYGLETPDLNGHPAPALKPTRWMSNSKRRLARLDDRCPRDQQHQPLLGGGGAPKKHNSTLTSLFWKCFAAGSIKQMHPWLKDSLRPFFVASALEPAQRYSNSQTVHIDHNKQKTSNLRTTTHRYTNVRTTRSTLTTMNKTRTKHEREQKQKHG